MSYWYFVSHWQDGRTIREQHGAIEAVKQRIEELKAGWIEVKDGATTYLYPPWALHKIVYRYVEK